MCGGGGGVVVVVCVSHKGRNSSQPRGLEVVSPQGHMKLMKPKGTQFYQCLESIWEQLIQKRTLSRQSGWLMLPVGFMVPWAEPKLL